MDFTSLLIGLLFGGIIGAVILYFIVKSSHIPRKTFDDLNQNFIRTNADLENSQFKNEEFFVQNSDLKSEIKFLQNEKQQLNILQSNLAAKNENLQILLETQKGEITKMQELAKIEFQNLANKILEEKTEKFTALNQTQLKNILEPFQEKINELRNKVGETYDKESK